MTSELNIYVPASVASLPIAARTALVSRAGPDSHGLVSCWFQEPTPDDRDMQFYAVRLAHAAQRLVSNAPTHRTIGFPVERLKPVGRYDGDRCVTSEITDQVSLETWAGEPMAAIVGMSLAAGYITLDEATYLQFEPRSWPIEQSGQVLWVRTQAGQVLQLDFAEKTARLWNFDDPTLVQQLRAAGVTEPRISRV